MGFNFTINCTFCGIIPKSQKIGVPQKPNCKMTLTISAVSLAKIFIEEKNQLKPSARTLIAAK